ncbi:alpha/beta fold hydrolase [Yoonia sediminilitoris]|uniref:Haloacetate dehalogenase n=1 Tax=Yoonia sediminilitoris TaxID=1286148 RepID=A0A2T6KN22_9RHOB|nr:alpha/beta hydrolase [Yoonia sediminilitoris]PUB17564.1 haloacetate dehalogenase [Yoonia sediminilitoris]RCW97859.1 haloacetate dehalogenase [Yoonia sediminilitoris]
MHPAAQTAAIAPSFFEGFEERFFDGPDGPVFYRIGGRGAPLVLLHGYPQTSAMWHAVAADLARDYCVICPDLRGYGRSVKPATDAQHSPYSKRAMGSDVIALMDHLGHDRVLLGSHDRGSRVAHRLAADHPHRVRAIATLDIAPTREMYRDARSGFAHTYWHWYWLTLPQPFPETLIGADPDFFWLGKCGAGSAGLTPFVQQALHEYLTCFADPAAIHGACEDYRAAATIDIAHDDADPGKLQMPLLALWGKSGAIEAHFDCLALWKERADDVQGQAIPGGHYLAEQSPTEVIAAWRPFFGAAPT